MGKILLLVGLKRDSSSAISFESYWNWSHYCFMDNKIKQHDCKFLVYLKDKSYTEGILVDEDLNSISFESGEKVPPKISGLLSEEIENFNTKHFPCINIQCGKFLGEPKSRLTEEEWAFGCSRVFDCDVEQIDDIQAAYEEIRSCWRDIEGLVRHLEVIASYTDKVQVNTENDNAFMYDTGRKTAYDTMGDCANTALKKFANADFLKNKKFRERFKDVSRKIKTD